MAAQVVYTAITSLDGYVADAYGNFDWSMPDHEVHAFVNGLESMVGTYLLGRRMYEVLKVWETLDDPDPVMRDYASVWRSIDKVVYSTTLTEPETARTEIRRVFDADQIRDLLEAATHEVSIGGPTLAASALRDGLVDEVRQFVSPVIVGGGIRFLPDDIRLELSLLDHRRFDNGVVFLRYRVVR